MFNGKLLCNTRSKKIYTSLKDAAKEFDVSPVTIWYYVTGRFENSYRARRYPVELIPAKKIRYTLCN